MSQTEAHPTETGKRSIAVSSTLPDTNITSINLQSSPGRRRRCSYDPGLARYLSNLHRYGGGDKATELYEFGGNGCGERVRVKVSQGDLGYG